jgi:PAS domain S-box-containing protein
MSELVRQPKVLIIDDDEQSCLLASEWLFLKGYNIDWVTSSSQALGHPHLGTYDLFLLDINMPFVSGIDLCKSFKQNVATQQIPVIFLTASNKFETLIECFECGAVDYIQKPFSGEELMARVEVHLSLKIANETLKKELAEKALNAERLERLLNISQLRFSSKTALLEKALNESIQLTHSKFGVLYLLNTATTKPYPFVASLEIEVVGIDEHPLHKFLVRTSFFDQVKASGKPVIDNYLFTGSIRNQSELPANMARQMLALPVFFNGVLAAIVVLLDKENGYNDLDIRESELLWNAVWNMAELKRAENALEKSQKKYHLLFENISQGFAMFRTIKQKGMPDYTMVLEVNPALTSLLRKNQEVIIGKQFSEIVSGLPKDFEASLQYLLFAEGYYEEEFYETDLRKYLYIYAFRTGNDSFIALFNDISDRKRAELAVLHEARITQHLAMFFKPVSSGFTTLNEIADSLDEILKSLLNCEYTIITEVKPKSGELVVLNSLSPKVFHDKLIPAKNHSNEKCCNGIPGYSINTHFPFFVNKRANIPASIFFDISPNELRNILLVPVVTEHTVLGEIAVINKHNDITDDDLEAVQRLAERFAIAIERKWAEAGLKKSEEKFRTFFDQSNDYILIVDHDYKIIEANGVLQEILGFDPAGKDLHLNDLIYSRGNSEMDRLQSPGFNFLNFPVEFEILTKENNRIYVEINKVEVEIDEQKLLLITLHNISQRKELDRLIMQAALQSEEKERRRFAKDLHDGIGPILSTIKLYIRALEIIEEKDKKQMAMQKLHETIDEAIQNMREISNNLSPHVLQNFGLEAAINAFLSRIKATNTIEICFTINLKHRLSEAQETAIYRICQELTNNSLKHGRATKIVANIYETQGSATFEFTDNGIGFDVNTALTQASGMGLINIRNRVNALNGSLSILSTAHNGTRITISFETENHD